jgi:transcriptional regulator with PAS, ATPase and Fis domain
VANGGTIFLDEVAELPMQTQVRLLRVLETGEFMRVGASKVIKTDVRVVAATNENMASAIASGKFREDLYYRLNTVPIQLPALKNRKEDIHLLFRKFAHDFAEKYRMPAIKLSEDAVHLIEAYAWPGNIRQLKNLVEQLSVIETDREIDAFVLSNYIQDKVQSTDLVLRKNKIDNEFSERELMYKFLFDMKKDLSELKKLVLDIVSKGGDITLTDGQSAMISRMHDDTEGNVLSSNRSLPEGNVNIEQRDGFEVHQEVEESLSLEDREKELIQKALDKHRGKRKYAASELGISERTLYRKIKEYNLSDK